MLKTLLKLPISKASVTIKEKKVREEIDRRVIGESTKLLHCVSGSRCNFDSERFSISEI